MHINPAIEDTKRGAPPVYCLTTKKNRQKETPYLNHTGQTRKSKVTKFLQQQYDQFVLDILTDIACPHCQNSSGLTQHGRYRRHLYYVGGFRGIIEVMRLRCHACTKTFVLLPPSIVPYKRYVLASILQAVHAAAAKSVYYAEYSLDLSARLIRRWCAHYSQWHKMLCQTHDINLRKEAKVAAIAYSQLRPSRRLMQVISAWTPAFHAL